MRCVLTGKIEMMFKMLSASVEKGEVGVTRVGNPKNMATAVRVHNNSMVSVHLSDRRLASHATDVSG